MFRMQYYHSTQAQRIMFRMTTAVTCDCFCRKLIQSVLKLGRNSLRDIFKGPRSCLVCLCRCSALEWDMFCGIINGVPIILTACRSIVN